MSKKFQNYNDLPKQFNRDLDKWLSSIKIYNLQNGETKKLKPRMKRFVNSENVITILN